MPRTGRTGQLSVAGSLAAALKPGATVRRGAALFAPSRSKPKSNRLRPHVFTDILRNLSTLVGNGVPLPKALATLAQEESLARHRHVLDAVRRKIESGGSFSSALAECVEGCDRITTAQIRIGERAGTLADSLRHLAETRDKAGELRSQIVKKLAYPTMLVVLGSGLISFLLLYVVPVFQQTYADANVPLPLVTQALIAVGVAAKSYLWIAAAAAVLGAVGVKQLRRNTTFAARMDLAMLKAPVVGKLLRDMAV
ncbi:MAG: hypothetical protein DCC67_12345, partial [Planctomycetota bacterium]